MKRMSSGQKTTMEVSDENWRRLNARKRPGDSFNDVLDRLLDGGEQDGE